MQSYRHTATKDLTLELVFDCPEPEVCYGSEDILHFPCNFRQNEETT